MSTELYEGFGNSSRNDPTTRVKLADDAGTLILNLGDRGQTLIVDEATQTIQLLNKLIDINNAAFKDLIPEEAAAAGFGVHVAATTDSNRGHTAAKIDVQNDDGTVADELQSLFLIAADGGAVGTADDINLRLGASQTGDDAFVEILVDGKWSTDILRIEGSLATELLSLLTPPAPALFTEGDDTIDFRALDPGDYLLGSEYDALDGDDRVTLPGVEDADLLGFDLEQPFFTGTGFDGVTGSTGNDYVIFGGRGSYTDLGGDDTVIGGTELLQVVSGDGGNDVFDFGDGRDEISYFRATSGVILDLQQGLATGAAGYDTLLGSLSFVKTTQFDDVIIGTDAPAPFNTGYSFYLYDGNDTVMGGDAAEVVFLQVGTGTGHKVLHMGGDGTTARDIISFNFITEDTIINAAEGTYSGYGTGEFSGVEEYQLGDGSDTFIGSERQEYVRARLGDDTIDGAGGDDRLYSGAGDTSISGGSGDDLIFASTGNETLDGGEGYDTLHFGAFPGTDPVTINLAEGTLTSTGTNSSISGFESVADARGDDIIIGSDADEFLKGEFGNNTLTGGGGADEFWFIPTGSGFGDNVITDFNAGEGDKLTFFGAGYLRSEAQVGDDVVVSITDLSDNPLGSVTLLDLTLDQLL